jgi:quercetin dioxygenase-like cupin family protein
VASGNQILDGYRAELRPLAERNNMDSTNVQAPEEFRGLVATENIGPAQKHSLLSQLITTLVSGRETNGRFSMLLFEGPANEPIPAHVHTQEDEWYYVVEGKIRWWHGTEHRLLYPGDSVYVPANVVHCFKLEGGYNKMVGLNVTAGFEDFFGVIGSRTEAFSAPQEYQIPTEQQWRDAADQFGWHAIPDYDYGI